VQRSSVPGAVDIEGGRTADAACQTTRTIVRDVTSVCVARKLSSNPLGVRGQVSRVLEHTGVIKRMLVCEKCLVHFTNLRCAAAASASSVVCCASGWTAGIGKWRNVTLSWSPSASINPATIGSAARQYGHSKSSYSTSEIAADRGTRM